MQTIPKVKSGLITLEYYSANWLHAQISVGTEYDGRTPVCCRRYAANTAGGTIEVEMVKNGVANIWASGNFVQGHLMSVAWTISDQ